MEFSLPIRVRWDIEPQGRERSVLRIASRIREIDPLFVELSAAGPVALPHLQPVVGMFSGGFTRLSLTLSPLPGAALAAAGLEGIDLVWRIARPGDFARLPEGAAAASFVPDGDTIGLLPGILDAFSRSGASSLHLPNVNAVRALAEGGRVPVPAPAQYAAFESAPELAKIALGDRRLVVHDYFLWRILAGRFPEGLGERLEFGGCQAGSALAYVDPEGNLYPCDAFPQRLGNLEEAGFQELWDAAARLALVEGIRATPAGCAGCELLPACRAGCRGMARVASGTVDAPDPACPGPGGHR
jgi:GeoRSP system SPASM domain protein